MYKAIVAALLLGSASFAAHAATDCSRTAPTAVAFAPTMLAPLAPELVAPDYRPGGHGGVLSRGYGEAQSLDHVLLRLQMERCMSAPGAGYVKQTEFDNTPFRFNMTQGGKRMTADDFDAWLQANGYSAGRRVAPNAPQLTDVLPVSEVPPAGE